MTLNKSFVSTAQARFEFLLGNERKVKAFWSCPKKKYIQSVQSVDVLSYGLNIALYYISLLYNIHIV